MLTVVQPSRGGCAVMPTLSVPAASAPTDGSPSRVVKYRIPAINTTPATMAAMIGTLLVRLPGLPDPDSGCNVGSFPR